jgi:hypothetical protein
MAVTTTWSNPATAKGSGGLDFATSDTIDETTLDRYASNLYHLGGTAGHIGARVYHSADQSITTATETTLAFNSERYDLDPNGAIHDTATNNSRLTARTAGRYLVGCNFYFVANSTGYRYCYLLLNGSTQLAFVSQPAVNGDINGMQVVTVYEFNATDYVEVRVYQTSGGGLNVVAGGQRSPEFWMAKV